MLVAGVINLVHLINEIKQHHPGVSYADTFQLGSALSIEVGCCALLRSVFVESAINLSGLLVQEAGGPHIPLRFGRVDVAEHTGCAKEGRLPGGYCMPLLNWQDEAAYLACCCALGSTY